MTAVADQKSADLELLDELRERVSKINYSGHGLVERLIVSPKHGIHESVPQFRVMPGIGVEGDRPFKQWWRGRRMVGRQISAMNSEVLDAIGVDYDVPGDNLIIRGIDLSQLEKGDMLRVGDAVLVATGTAHRPCKLFIQRTSTAHYVAISQGRLRGVMLDAKDAATIRVGDAVELIVPCQEH